MIDSLYEKFKPWSATGSIYLISDTHFDDPDCKLMDPAWITPQEHMKKIKAKVWTADTLIHLGDVGNPDYLDELTCYKVLITGNHDVLSKVASHFDEVYTGPLFIADRLVLSHEPIEGLEKFALNIHGHVHDGAMVRYYDIGGQFRVSHLNLASNIAQYEPCSLKTLIKDGYLANIPNYHRVTIDKASKRKTTKISNNDRDFWEYEKGLIGKLYSTPFYYISNPCRRCPNHPINGGNGICNCTLGLPKIIY